MTIADDKENPKDGKRSSKPLDAMTALRIAMEERLAATYQATAKMPTANIPVPTDPVAIAPVPDMAEPVVTSPADKALPAEPETPAPILTASEGPAVPQTPISRPLSEPHDLPEAFAKISERSQKLWQDFLARNKNMLANLPSFDAAHLSEAFTVLSDRILHDPDRYADAQITLWQGYIKIWQTALSRMQGKDVAPLMAPAPSDKRFLDQDWQNNWIFEFLKQSYLLTAKWTQLMVRQEIADIDPKMARKLDFYMRQMIDAASPSNFWMTNPEVLRTTLATGGENLIKGFENLLSDLERGHGQLRIKMSDEHAFHVGTAEHPDNKNDDVKYLATTPGKVVFQNRLIQLIQYEPVTPNVNRTPILILPPWINKFYILDLSPKKSFIGHLVAQGHTVFCVSWVNPDANLADIGFDDYMTEGSLAAMREVRRATGEDKINMVGYCIGGTLLASTLAYLKAVPQPPKDIPETISATYLVTMIDFSEPGDLGVFIDEEQIAAIEERMAQQGYLDAASMATTFNLLRSNDLIWSFVVNNYLLGKEPFPFDILYWNADSTNLPAKMHSYYLREMYLHNKLAQPYGLSMKAVPIDVRSITTPSFLLSTSEDHIAPWRSTYAATQLYQGPVTFMLSGSGHIAGIVNPPSAKKYSYWVNSKLPPSPDAWLETAQAHEGSWWPAWLEWLKPYAGGQVPARQIKNAIEAAPGSFVKVMAN